MNKIKKLFSLFFICLISSLLVSFSVSAINLQSDFLPETININEITDKPILEIPVDSIQVPNGLINPEEIYVENATTKNTPPVAALQAVVLNPDSLINGKLTTATQIAWLWSYNGQDFTYDPDGDKIVKMQIGGISSSDVIGYITGNIGFATQFKTPAQYVLTFQAQDEKGAWSNIAQYPFSIEPADGSSRPVCNVKYGPKDASPNEPIKIDWSGSFDPDGSAIASIGGLVIKDDVTTSLLDYITDVNATSCTIKLPETGNYKVWFRLADETNAWSDWAILSVSSQSFSIQDIEIIGIDGPSDSSHPDAWWVDDKAARDCSVAASPEGAQYLLDHFASKRFPSELPSKILMSGAFEVKGTITDSNGNPVANEEVLIDMPLTYGRKIYQIIYTDQFGNFSYKPDVKQFWFDSGYHTPDDFNFEDCGDTTVEYTKYTRFSKRTGTNHFYPTTLKVNCKNATYSERVTCEVGYTKLPSLGRMFYIDDSTWISF